MYLSAPHGHPILNFLSIHSKYLIFLNISVLIFTHLENVSEAEISGGDYVDVEKTALCDVST